ncbi:hypothetical protein C8R43DRAFT_949918 [Mycena crocata]|nr:hypothetical protein C8R43DRAFT_949918 [Mycena crocata]
MEREDDSDDDMPGLEYPADYDYDDDLPDFTERLPLYKPLPRAGLLIEYRCSAVVSRRKWIPQPTPVSDNQTGERMDNTEYSYFVSNPYWTSAAAVAAKMNYDICCQYIPLWHRTSPRPEVLEAEHITIDAYWASPCGASSGKTDGEAIETCWASAQPGPGVPTLSIIS